MINNTTISPSRNARMLGVTLDPDLSFRPHIQPLSKSCHFDLRNISKTKCPFFANDTTKQLIQPLFVYCNSLLFGIPLHRLCPLQPLMNATTRLTHLTNRSLSITPPCQSLHWLPITQQIKFKPLTTYKGIHNPVPSYITNLISKYHSNLLCSSEDPLLPRSFFTFSQACPSRTSPERFPSSGTPYSNLSGYLPLCPPLGNP